MHDQGVRGRRRERKVEGGEVCRAGEGGRPQQAGHNKQVTTSRSQQAGHNKQATTSRPQQAGHHKLVTTSRSQQAGPNKQVTTSRPQQACHNKQARMSRPQQAGHNKGEGKGQLLPSLPWPYLQAPCLCTPLCITLKPLCTSRTAIAHTLSHSVVDPSAYSLTQPFNTALWTPLHTP